MSAPLLLLVEPHNDSLRAMSELLRHAGFRTVPASTADEAYAQLRDNVFDVVVAELRIAGLDRSKAWGCIDEMRSLARLAPLGLVTTTVVSPEEVTAHRFAFALLKPVWFEDLFAALASCTRSPDLEATKVATLRAYFSCLETSDWDQLVALCTTNVTYHLPGDDPHFSRVVQGRESFRAFAAETFAAFADPRFSLTSIRSLPAGALVRYDASWQAPSPQGRSSTSGGIYVRFEDDLIAEIGVRTNLRVIRSAVGG